jgi:hypothetical protein
MDFLNKKSWHPGSFKNRTKVFLAEEKQRESEKKHKALLDEYKAQSADDGTNVAFLYTAPPGYNAEQQSGGMPEDPEKKKNTHAQHKGQTHVSRVIDGIQTHAIPVPGYVMNQFEDEDEEQQAYELAMIEDVSERRRVFEKQQRKILKKKKKKESKQRLKDARKILADAGLLC